MLRRLTAKKPRHPTAFLRLAEALQRAQMRRDEAAVALKRHLEAQTRLDREARFWHRDRSGFALACSQGDSGRSSRQGG